MSSICQEQVYSFDSSNWHVVPTAILTRSRLAPLNAARPVNTVVPQTKVHHQRPTKHGVHKPHLPLSRPINCRPSPPASNFHQKVTTAKAPQEHVVMNPTQLERDRIQMNLLDRDSQQTSRSRYRIVSKQTTRKASTNSDIQDLPLRYRVYQGRLLENFQDDAKDEHLVEHPIPSDNLRKDIPLFRGHRNSKNRNACFICKSLTHLIKDCDYYKKKMVQKPVRNHAIRGNHQHYARITHLNPQRHVVPTAILTRSRLAPLNAARPVNTVVPQTKVHHQRPTKHGVHKPHLPLSRPINCRPSPPASNFHQKVTTAKAPQVNAV
nr:hypothetical protein [Tanacetum cinerariifolium]